MKYLIIDHKNVIFHISDTIDYQSNGNPLVDYGTLAIAKYLVKDVIEIDETQVTLPEDLVVYKYKYLEGSLVLNPDYVDPAPERDFGSEIDTMGVLVDEHQSSIEEIVTALNILTGEEVTQ